MVQDFYQEQQIKGPYPTPNGYEASQKSLLTIIIGAKIYYIRHCLHNLPDAIAKQVLRRIRDAMSPQSLLLIDELVIPDTGASPYPMQLDFT